MTLPIILLLATAGVRNVAGEFGGAAFRRILHRHADGSLCLKFGHAWLRAARIAPAAPRACWRKCAGWVNAARVLLA